jgi:hypothetical protein
MQLGRVVDATELHKQVYIINRSADLRALGKHNSLNSEGIR